MQDQAGQLEVVSPRVPGAELYDDPKAAVARLCELYDAAAEFLRDTFLAAMESGHPGVRYRVSTDRSTVGGS